MVLEKTLESPLDFKEIQPVHPKGNQSWIFIGRTDAEAETPIFWSPDVKNWLIGKDPDAGKDWRQEEKGTTEDEMVGWPHWFDGHEFEWAPRVGDGQGSLACCNPWGCTVGHDWVTKLNWPKQSCLFCGCFYFDLYFQVCPFSLSSCSSETHILSVLEAACHSYSRLEPCHDGYPLTIPSPHFF